VLALDPVTHEPHVAYVSNAVLYHAWRSGGTWQTEVVASSVYGSASSAFDGVDLKIAPDGRPVATWFVTGAGSGIIVAAIRNVGGWFADTLDFLPGGFTSPALAVSPLTGEPSVAWGKRPGPVTPLDIKLARHSGGAWNTQVLDTTTISPSVLAVAVDFADRPSVAWLRLRADGRNARVLTCGTATAPAGPFELAAVDSEFTLGGYFALAVDPNTGEPRLAYNATAISNQRSIRYAARDGGIGWQRTVVRAFADFSAVPSLALDPNGDPFVGLTVMTPIGPAEIRDGAGPGLESCVVVATGDICLSHRAGGAGTGDFQLYDCVNTIEVRDAVNASRSVASLTNGVVDVAWRTPSYSCAPYSIHYQRSTPLAGVPPGAGPHVALAPIAPNPARLGGSLRVAFELAGAADATVELHDLAGRRIAEQSLGALPAGPHAFDWQPVAPRVGLYWLMVRAGDARIGARPVVLAQ
jgi:hypothetical protein